jgi:hypothetical protein
MKRVDIPISDEFADPLSIASGEPLPGAQLAADVQYMDAESAKRATQLIDSWRQMPRDDFEFSAHRL